MGYEEIITKILGEHTEREGEVASLVLDFVVKNPDWRLDELKIYDDKVIQAVDTSLREQFGLPLSSYMGRSRDMEQVAVRQMVCLFLRETTPYSLNQIAKVIRRDHATVLYSARAAKDRLQYEKTFRENYNNFKNSCLEKL